MREDVLDDPDGLRVADPGWMMRAAATAGAQLRSGWRAAQEAGVDSLTQLGRPRALIVAAVGGSAQAGDVLASLAGSGAPFPVLVVRNPVLPGWVGPLDVVCAVSCSGRTQETLAVVEEAARRGCTVVGVGSAGSPLAQAVAALPSGVVIPVAAEDRPPRMNLWGLAMPLLAVGAALGLPSFTPSEVEQAAARLDEDAVRCGPASSTVVNPAKSLAVELAGTLPLVWGSGEVAEAAARRFAGQLAENAKMPAVFGVLPEVCHGQIVAFDGMFGALRGQKLTWAGEANLDPDDFFRDRGEDIDEPLPAPLHLVLLRDSVEHPQLAHMCEAVQIMARDRGVGLRVIRAEGDTALERLTSLVGMLDFASIYTGMVQGIDPQPIGAIDELKLRIS